jgi:hypothetical protein
LRFISQTTLVARQKNIAKFRNSGNFIFIIRLTGPRSFVAIRAAAPPQRARAFGLVAVQSCFLKESQ